LLPRARPEPIFAASENQKPAYGGVGTLGVVHLCVPVFLARHLRSNSKKLRGWRR